MVDGIGELVAVRSSVTSAGIAGSVEPDSPIDELLLFVIMALLRFLSPPKECLLTADNLSMRGCRGRE